MLLFDRLERDHLRIDLRSSANYMCGESLTGRCDTYPS